MEQAAANLCLAGTKLCLSLLRAEKRQKLEDDDRPDVIDGACSGQGPVPGIASMRPRLLMPAVARCVLLCAAEDQEPGPSNRTKGCTVQELMSQYYGEPRRAAHRVLGCHQGTFWCGTR